MDVIQLLIYSYLFEQECRGSILDIGIKAIRNKQISMLEEQHDMMPLAIKDGRDGSSSSI